MTDLERQIAERLIAAFLSRGYRVSVSDGEDIVLSYADDSEFIMKSMASTGGDVLFVHEPRKCGDGYRTIGWVQLTWGNGLDLIANSSVGMIEDALRPVEEWVNSLEETLRGDETDGTEDYNNLACREARQHG